jgi:ribonuclease HI
MVEQNRLETLVELHSEKHAMEQTAYVRGREAHSEKHTMEQKAIKTALSAAQQREAEHRTAHTDAHLAHEKIHEVAGQTHIEQHRAEQRAVETAVAAMDKRLDGMNATREQLRDQATTFARVDSLIAFEKMVSEKIEMLDKRIDTEREERRESQNLRVGTQRGISQSTAVIVIAIGIVGTLLAIATAVANFRQ